VNPDQPVPSQAVLDLIRKTTSGMGNKNEVWNGIYYGMDMLAAINHVKALILSNGLASTFLYLSLINHQPIDRTGATTLTPVLQNQHQLKLVTISQK